MESELVELFFGMPDIDVNAIDQHNGWSALAVAARDGWTDDVRLLIGKGAQLSGGQKRVACNLKLLPCSL